MKTTYTVNRDQIVPLTNDKELLAFRSVLQFPVTHASLAALSISIPDNFDLTHNTNPDDPPDIVALGLGWEHTEFPPDQSPIMKVHSEKGTMNVPGYSQTGGNIGEIRKQSDPFGSFLTGFCDTQKEIDALEYTFLNKIIDGPRSKDVPGNDVLLLDATRDFSPEKAEKAILQALQKKKPQFIKLILKIGWNLSGHLSAKPVPEVICMFLNKG